MSSRDYQPDQGSQRTVAELIAQYGSGAVPPGGRRRRRRASDPDDTAPHAIIERVLSDSGTLRPITDAPQDNTHTPPEPSRTSQRPTSVSPTGETTADLAGRVPARTRQSMRSPLPAERRQRVDEEPTDQIPRISERAIDPILNPPAEPRMGPTGRAGDLPVAPARPARSSPPREPRTPRTPRLADRADRLAERSDRADRHADRPDQADRLAGRTGGTDHLAERPARDDRLADRAGHADPLAERHGHVDRSGTRADRFGEHGDRAGHVDRPGEPVDRTGRPDRAGRVDRFGERATRLPEQPGRPTEPSAGMVGQSARRRPREEPVAGVEDTDVVSTAVIAVRAGDAAGPFAAGDNVDEDDELIDEEHSSAREWLAVVVQLVAGAVAGAALWLAFRWLWRGTPMIAAVAGVLVTVVAVLLVRRIWRSDDVRTTVMTVLIGLFVTMSPAVLLLDL